MSDSQQNLRRVSVFNQHPGRWLLAAGFAATLCLMFFFRWLALNSGGVNFLDCRGPADWILYPKPPSVEIHPVVRLETRFTRKFFLPTNPGSASLKVRGMKEWKVSLNGAELITGNKPADWKHPAELQAGSFLRAGTNELEVTVFNSNGPPALWLVLESGGTTIVSDTNWESSLVGAAPRPAVLSTTLIEPGKGNGLYGAEHTVAALDRCSPGLIGVLVIFAASLAAITWRIRKKGGVDTICRNRGFVISATAIPFLILAALFVNNLGLLPFEGKISTIPAPLLRVAGLLLTLVHVGLVYLCLRILLANSLGGQLAGLTLAAFLPVNIVFAQSQPGIALAGAAITGAIYCCLRIQRENGRRTAWYVGLGGCLLLALCGGGGSGIWTESLAGGRGWTEPGYATSRYLLGWNGGLAYPWYNGLKSFAGGIYAALWGDGLWSGQAGMAHRPPWNYDWMAAGYLLALGPVILIIFGAAIAGWRIIQKRDLAWLPLLGLAWIAIAVLIYQVLRAPGFGQGKAAYGLFLLLPLSAFMGVAFEFLLGRARIAGAIAAVILGTWAFGSCRSFWIERGNASSQAAIGRMFEAVGQGENARNHFSRALSLQATNTAAQEGLARLDLAAGNFVEARRLAELTIAQLPNDAEAHSLLASINSAQNRADAEVSEAQRSFELAPELPENFVILGNTLAKSGHNLEALVIGSAGLRVNPFNAALHYDVGLAANALGDATNALMHFRLATELRPGWPEAEAEYGATLLAVQRWDEALVLLKDAANRKPADGRIRYNLAFALAKLGRAAEAIREYQAALSITPNSAETCNNLAWLLATDDNPQLRNGAQAVQLATRACELTGRKQPSYLATLAASYAEAGQFPQAIAALNEAVVLARASGNANMAASFELLLKLFQANQPYHLPPRTPGLRGG